MVRFGNVLGSACSVLTIWGQQLAAGGPLTVTDPRMTRYFMTIPEAATLVIQSAALPPRRRPAARLQPGRIRRGVCARHGRADPDPGPGGAVPRGRTACGCASGGIARRPLLPAFQEWMWDRRAWLAGHGSGRRSRWCSRGSAREKLYEELAYAAELLEPTPHPGGAGVASGELGDIPLMLRELDAIRFLGDQAIVESLRRHVPEMRRSHGDLPADARVPMRADAGAGRTSSTMKYCSFGV